MDATAHTLIAAWLESLAEPHVLLDADYHILAANSAYRLAFGHSGQVAGRTCHAVSHHSSVPCDQAGETCPLARAQYSGQRERVLHLHHTNRGKEYVAIELQPLRTGPGPAQFFLEKMEPLHTASQGQGAMLGRSGAFTAVLELIARMGPSASPVLLQGEPGTGKERAAQALHAASPRARHPLVVADCASLPEAQLEAELFGQAARSTGTGTGSRSGWLDAAQGGSLLLADVDALPWGLQAQLLRLLDSGTYRRPGHSELRRADVRIIASTSRDIRPLVRAGQWRSDLYYRLSTLPIHLPPLRERGEDVALLASALLPRLAPGYSLAPAALRTLLRHPWPGNLHELRNVLERAALLADGRLISARAIGQALALDSASHPGTPLFTSPALPTRPGAALPPPTAEATLLHNLPGGTRAQQAQALGMSPRTLYRRLKALEQKNS